MSLPSFKDIAEKYNTLVIRERVLVLLLMLAMVFFFWYFLWGMSIENAIAAEKSKREALLSLSESVMSKYNLEEEKLSQDRNFAIIGKRMATVKSKMELIDSDLHRFNNETIAIGEIVLLLRDVLSANESLSLESLKVYPAEIIKKQENTDSQIEDMFEKNVISLTLKGSYSSVFDYLKKIEDLKWSVFWQDVKYEVEQYPTALVTIHLYTLSIIESEHYAAK